MYALLKRTIVAISLAFSLLAMPFAAASAHADDSSPSPDPSQPPITCTEGSATIAEGGTLTIPDVLSNCTSSLDETLTMTSPNCTTTEKCNIGGMWFTKAGKLTIQMAALRGGTEKDWTLKFAVWDTDQHLAWGEIQFHVVHYQPIIVKRLSKSRIRVTNPNPANPFVDIANGKGKTINGPPMSLTINWWSHAHNEHWGGKIYTIPPKSTRIFTLQARVQNQKNLSWVVNAHIGTQYEMNVGFHNTWQPSGGSRWIQMMPNWP